MQMHSIVNRRILEREEYIQRAIFIYIPFTAVYGYWNINEKKQVDGKQNIEEKKGGGKREICKCDVTSGVIIRIEPRGT